MQGLTQTLQIQLLDVCPTFIEEEKTGRSQVWNSDVSFQKGEKIQLVAPSGSGKTSLIHFLYGLRRDYAGEILFNNKNIARFDAEEQAASRRQFTSIVFQDLRLFREKTVRENLEIKRMLMPFHAEDRIKDMAGRLGIGSKLDKPCRTCSYGEQQRIAIIRALQQPFDFLLLDEPFSHLDNANIRLALELIEEEAALRKAAVIMADLEPPGLFKPDRTLNL